MMLTVWSLVIWGRDGDSTEVFATEESAKKALNAFITEQWTWRFDDLVPDDRERAANEYFRRRDDESAFISPHEIELGLATLFRAAVAPVVSQIAGWRSGSRERSLKSMGS